jgi:hypothetical protein
VLASLGVHADSGLADADRGGCDHTSQLRLLRTQRPCRDSRG